MVIYRASIPEIPVPNVDLLSLLFNKNEFNEKKDLNAPVFIDDENNKTLSWNQVRDQVLHLASGWIENVGLKQGDTVAVFAPNQVDHAVLYFSLLGAKCTVSPGNPAYTEGEKKISIVSSFELFFSYFFFS